MDFNEIFNSRDREIINLFPEGKSFVKMEIDYSEQTVYMFKFFDKYYECTTDGKIDGDIQCFGSEFDIGIKSRMLGTYLLGGGEKICFEDYLQIGKITVTTDYYKHKIFYSPDRNIYIWSDGICKKETLKKAISIIVNNYWYGDFLIRDLNANEINEIE